MPTPSAYNKLIAQQERLAEAYKGLFIAAQAVSDQMRQSVGGDAFTFDGSMNQIEQLRGELQRIETDDFLYRFAFPEIDLSTEKV